MRFTQTVKTTIKSTKREIAFFLCNCTILILIYNLYIDSIIILYPLLVSAAVLFVYLLIKGISLARFYTVLANSKAAPEEFHADDAMQTLVMETISGIHQKYLAQISGLHTQAETRNTLFSQFIHGMKSSVSVIELACEKHCADGAHVTNTLLNTPIEDIMIENEKLKINLEQALNLLRLDAFANDYVSEWLPLAALVTRVINDHKRDFIYAGVFPKLNGEAFVHTDAKWCGYMISQLISNAVKYSHCGANVEIIMETIDGCTQLHIRDYGVGIPPEDLPRVFDMFFTGKNGRQRKESTGIGLFMAKQIAEKLGIALNIDSEIGKGTTVTLTFRNLAKL